MQSRTSALRSRVKTTKVRSYSTYEVNLDKEETQVLEGIRDSLRGGCFHDLTILDATLIIDCQTTQIFHDQVEAKQKELQPWITTTVVSTDRAQAQALLHETAAVLLSVQSLL
ncbi:hypothetical protein EV702DRAFT_282497 [Suillus placidus]|uniref:Uncharacterized protein n=1 Tax=Suillus placidus TaxID=48579 RepID=A0A9P6ZH18_9AGAM|nr:hypothetical protein EV702DRAFT_282497 [Suillus placidus]